MAGKGLIIWHVGTDGSLNPYRLPDPTNPPMNPNGPVSVVAEGRNAANNGYSLGGDNTLPATQVWPTNLFAQLPTLRWFNGSPTSVAITARLGPDANSVFIEVIRQGENWAHFREQPAGIPEFGTFEFPWNTLTEAYATSPWGGNIRIKPGQTHETGTFNKRVVITAEGGPVTIGAR